jgi:spore germination cell wall hydrolase CwlJ-like protein
MSAAATCLALALYFEARSEPLQGQIAVGQVILHRVEDRRFPDTVCGVVTQRNQFSFYWDGRPDKPYEKAAWEKAQLMASALLSGESAIKDFSAGATHYATVGTHRYWMQGMSGHRIGNHVFYK